MGVAGAYYALGLLTTFTLASHKQPKLGALGGLNGLLISVCLSWHFFHAIEVAAAISFVAAVKLPPLSLSISAGVPHLLKNLENIAIT